MVPMKNKQQNKIWITILFFFGLNYVFPVAGTIIHFILLPIIFYMVYTEDPDYFPGLILLLVSGSFSAMTLYLSIFFVVLLKAKYFYNSDLKPILILLLLCLPLIIYHLIEVTLYYQELIPVVKSVQYYLAFFPFFYGYQIAKKINYKNINSIVIVLLLLLLAPLFGIPNWGNRITAFSIPFLFSLIFILNKKLLKNNYETLFKITLVFFAFFLIINRNMFSGHTILAIVLSSLIIIIRYKFSNFRILRILKPNILFFISVILIFITIYSTVTFSGLLNIDSGVENRFANLSNAINYGYFKIIGDRGPIWASIWNDLIKEMNIIPPVLNKQLFIMSNTTYSSFYIPMDAHNIYLELFRQFGIFIAPLLIAAYILVLSRASTPLFSKSTDTLLFALTASVLSVGIIGGFFGQFVLMPTFSFFFIGLAGMLYSLSSAQNKSQICQ